MSLSLNRRYLAKLLSSAINGLLTLAITAMVPRALGPSAYGSFTFLTTFFSNIISFFDTGSSIAFYTKLSKRQNEKTIIGFYFLFVCMLLISSLFLLYLSMQPQFRRFFYGHNEAIFIVAGFCFAFLTWISQIAIKISDAYAMTVSVEVIKTIHRVFFFFIIFSLVYFHILNLDYFFIYHLTLLSSFIFILYLYFRKAGIINMEVFLFELGSVKKYIYEFYLFSHPLVVGSIFSAISSIVSLWLLQQFYGNTQVGYYGFAYQIAAACFVFTAALTPIITREFSVSYEAGNFDEMRRLFLKYIPMLYSVAAFFSIFLAINSDIVSNLFGGNLYDGAIIIVGIMAMYPIHQTYGQLSGSVFYATENTKLSRNISMLSSIIFLLLNCVLLLPNSHFGIGLGAIGFAISMVVTQFISVNLQLWFNCKYLKLSFIYFVAHQIIVVALFAVIAYFARFLVLAMSIDGLYGFFAAGFIYVVVIFVFALTSRFLFTVNGIDLVLKLRAFKKRY